tara:strand:+ start:667 stop:855 length:189 start_codon:yes stop_codon:yes gene_type:complete
MSKLKRLLELVDDLNWDYERLSYGGQETLDKINQILEEIGNPKVVKERELWVENLKSDIRGD